MRTLNTSPSASSYVSPSVLPARAGLGACEPEFALVSLGWAVCVAGGVLLPPAGLSRCTAALARPLLLLASGSCRTLRVRVALRGRPRISPKRLAGGAGDVRTATTWWSWRGRGLRLPVAEPLLHMLDVRGGRARAGRAMVAPTSMAAAFGCTIGILRPCSTSIFWGSSPVFPADASGRAGLRNSSNSIGIAETASHLQARNSPWTRFLDGSYVPTKIVSAAPFQPQSSEYSFYPTGRVQRRGQFFGRSTNKAKHKAMIDRDCPQSPRQARALEH